MVPVLLPLELPEPVLPLLEPEPMLPLEPVLGEVLGEVVELLLPLVPPLLAPDLLKWASHSEREIEPSLLVSTDEKLGAALLELLPDMPLLEPLVAEPPLAAEPLLEGEELDEPLEPPLAAGEDDDLSLVVLLDELCATAAPESANSAAAVAALMSLRFNIGKILLRVGGR